MITFLLVMHVIFAGIMIMFILLHRGTGGGMSDMFGGGGGGMQGSAIVEKNLDRLTIFSAVAFLIADGLLVKYM